MTSRIVMTAKILRAYVRYPAKYGERASAYALWRAIRTAWYR